MFNLAILKDTIPIHPSLFGVPPEQSLISELNKKYANRVLHDVGLCVCVFDLVEAGEGRVRYGDGFLWYKAVFRMVACRPFTSEVILARVKSSDEYSIRLSIGFFDDIYIPAIYLPQPSAFDPQERAHFWLPETTSETPENLLTSPIAERMYIEKDEVLRVRVETDEFYDDEPGPPVIIDGQKMEKIEGKRRAPYTICSIAEQGLGPVAWWKNADTADDEDGGMEE